MRISDWSSDVCSSDLWRSTLCMASFAKARLFPRRDVCSLQDWTVNAFGHKLFSIFFKTYTEKVWGMPCDEMSADWAAQRIKGLSLWGAVTDGLKRRSEEHTSELQSLMRISYAVFCLKKKK